MPLRTIAGLDAVANIRANPYAEWPAREPADANRIEPYGAPGFSPSFQLEPGEKIFTIGSCFARNIERALAKRGFDVVTLKLDWPDKASETHVDSVLNNYGVVSMENEFRWALDPAHPFDPAAHIFQLGPEHYLDPHLAVRPTNLDRMKTYRTAVTAVTRMVTECRVVIMTLGLSELWFDKQTQTYLNLAPPRTLVARNAERFEIHLLSFDETLKSLNTAIAMLKKYCRADLRILLTVSPVPMNTTHTAEDVLVINTYSKSVLRTAAEHVAAANAHIDYFPSYESVVLSDHARAWQDDQVHVRDTLIQFNVERMLHAYVPADQALPLNTKLILNNAGDEIAAQDFQTAIRTLEPLRNAAEIDPDFAGDYAELCLALGRGDDARAVLGKLPAGTPDWRRKAIAARIMVHDGRVDEGIAMLTALVTDRPKNPLLWRTLTDIYEELERWDDALLATRRWADLLPGKAGPYRRAARIHIKRGDLEAAERAFREMTVCAAFSDIQMLEFIEFLIDQKRFADAAREIEFVQPESLVTRRRVERIKMFLPSRTAAAS
jgi:tetratricopeptide (TPR) repeat protein